MSASSLGSPGLAAVTLLLAACVPVSSGYQTSPPPGAPYPAGQWNPGPQQPAPQGWGTPAPQGPWGPTPAPSPYPSPNAGPNPAPGGVAPGQPIPGLPGVALPQIPGLPAPAMWWPPAWGPMPNLGVPLPGNPALPGAPVNPVTPNLPANPGDPAQRCVDTINQYRAGLGLAALGRWSSAESCASSQGQNGAQTGQPHGAFGQCGEMAQNVCPNWPGPPDSVTSPCLKQMYDEGPGVPYEAHGHYLNMTSTKYSKVACGYYAAPGGSVWAVQDFQ